MINIDTITRLHELLGYDKPIHPLITLIDINNIQFSSKYENRQMVVGFYTISLKDGHNCKFKYGRQYYDFSEGSMMFTAPGQVGTVEHTPSDAKGWMLCFHPDLIRKSQLNSKIKEYTFFSYDSSEALHLSEQEEETINNIVNTIKEEINENSDIYSDELIVSNLEVLLNYARRFYGRQFITRNSANKDVISRFETFLTDYFQSKDLVDNGLPTVKYLAGKMGYSTNYLSDVLKKETGKNTQEHIHFQLIEKAKSLLLSTEESVAQVAYTLGFEYPGHFSKLFKKKTGMSPSEYRR
ncbi:AraC family transcriptional regulator [Anaeromicrobium sediminis]|uniref:AraC family transcriptional regulator n=1 Tax=Anaeromicrobium sediminis TaxID=1478221 RepID=A0A267MPA1_9FIRM|nr:AraC family transcriptional regulator [Anaeromicrobium sediminis]